MLSRTILQTPKTAISPRLRFILRTYATPSNNNPKNFSFNLGQEPQPGESLKKYSIDLTELAKEGKLDPVIGRDDEIRRTIQILSRRTKNNPALVGPAGVGKTAIMVDHVCYRRLTL
jgi:ATP-dependent Clp protease ATP-binding subunit ClpB